LTSWVVVTARLHCEVPASATPDVLNEVPPSALSSATGAAEVTALAEHPAAITTDIRQAQAARGGDGGERHAET
jgi:hypothetical protein